MARLASQAVFLTLEKIAHLGGGLVLLVAVARLLGEEALGEYAFVIAATALFVPILDAGLNNRAIRQVSLEADWTAVSEAIAFRLKMGPFVLALMVGIAWGAGKFGDIIVAVVLLGVSTLAMSGGDAVNAGFKGWLRAHYGAVGVGLVNVCLVGASIWAMAAGWGIVGIALAYMACRVGYGVGMFWFLKRKVAGVPLLQAVHFGRASIWQSIHFMPAVFFIGCLLHLNFLTADWLGDGDGSGFFAIGYRMASALFVLGAASLEALLAIIAKGEGSSRSLWRDGWILMGVGIFGVACVQWGAEPITLWVFGAEYRPAVEGMLVLGWSLPPFLLCGFLHTVLLARGQERVGFVLMGFLVVGGMVLGAIGFLFGGALGTAFSPAITGWIFVVIMLRSVVTAIKRG